MTTSREASRFDWSPADRARRCWRAHGRSQAHLTVLQALSTHPDFAWTPEHLFIWYGVRLDRAQAIMRELAGCGIARSVAGGSRGYVWDRRLVWATSEEASGWRGFRERWAELGVSER